jgi:hypothetical protein
MLVSSDWIPLSKHFSFHILHLPGRGVCPDTGIFKHKFMSEKSKISSLQISFLLPFCGGKKLRRINRRDQLMSLILVLASWHILNVLTEV